MKKIMLPLALLLGTASVKAQYRVGFFGGAHSSSITPGLKGPEGVLSTTQTSRTGLHFGFIADIPLVNKNWLFLQSGVMYSAKGATQVQTLDSNLTRIKSISNAQHINYIDIPFNLVYKLSLGAKTKFILGGGPHASLFYNGRTTVNTFRKGNAFSGETNEDLPVGNGDNKYRFFHAGVNGLAGFELGKTFFTVNYSKGITPFYTEEGQEYKHGTIGATLGIFLGKNIKQEPVVKDKDADGVPDVEDECPTEAGGLITKGCPDKDGDGIADKADQCIEVAGLLKYNGCPVPDRDKDGVNDEEDSCPELAGIAKYKGCPVPDKDGDGVNDEEDLCPDTAGKAVYKGCPVPDKDSDGINDEEDRCPDEPGTKENAGCPEIKKEIIEKVNLAARNIQFEFNKAELLPESYKVLDEVIEVLKKYPQLKLTVEGHSSTTGNKKANQEVSQKRADAVKRYIVGVGISEVRITAQGFGSSRPIVSGKTEEEQALNRRVELILSY